MTQFFTDDEGIVRCNGCGNTKHNCEVGGTCLDPIGAQHVTLVTDAELQESCRLTMRDMHASDLNNEYPPHITPMPNGQTLGEVMSAIDNDPIIPGVIFNGVPLRQSVLDGLCPEDHERWLKDEEHREKWENSARYRHDYVHGKK